MAAGTEQPILEQVRTKGHARSHGCDFKHGPELEGPRGSGSEPPTNVLRGGRRVAPLVSAEYSTRISRPEGSSKGGSPGPDGKSDRNGPGGYGLMMTRVPMSTRSNSSSESEMYIRMQPCDAYVPIDDELYVPWMRIPGALR